jgi:hypothetical protein
MYMYCKRETLHLKKRLKNRKSGTEKENLIKARRREPLKDKIPFIVLVSHKVKH